MSLYLWLYVTLILVLYYQVNFPKRVIAFVISDLGGSAFPLAAATGDNIRQEKHHWWYNAHRECGRFVPTAWAFWWLFHFVAWLDSSIKAIVKLVKLYEYMAFSQNPGLHTHALA